MQRQSFEPWFIIATEAALSPQGQDPEEQCYQEIPRKGKKTRIGRYILGLFLIILLCLVWTIASVMTQYLYSEQEFDSPFLMTYIGVTTLAMLLPIKYITDRAGCTTNSCHSSLESDSFDQDIASASTYKDVMKIVSVRTNDLIQNKHVSWSHKKHILAALQ